jgi:hypothetical protein
MSRDRFRLSMNQQVLRYRYEKWAWIAITAVVVALSQFNNTLWSKISIVYLAVVSNYALVLTAGGAEQAAIAALQASDESSS